ncbi:NACHT domain-containing protein [Marinobacterium stanieri]|uniref:NACHT domain-containing protein n=1 Tax=Marinobacterium stanieri TaxID=49186 RepID=A0A1N6P0L2_9GAMM|nr:NACHT domain-containing protein [Marinobacterium stanieri]SIP97881.1 NACHT domain-containing protein [Marinobacterium stanieri]
MEPATTAAITSFAGKALLPLFQKAISKGLSLAWRSGSEEAKTIFQLLKSDDSAKRYCEHAQKILRIRTIFDPDTIHDIPNIYHPLSAKSKKRQAIKIESLSDITGLTEFKKDNIFVNLVGKAGQGKSTSFKYIFGETLKEGNKIPFYFNLRDFGDGTIEEELFKGFIHFVSDIEFSTFTLLLQSKRIVIFLDGFDEVESSKRGYWLKEIEKLSIRYMADILVSSRPDTEICRSVNIENIFLCDLSKQDIFSIIYKNSKNSIASQEYISIVNENKTLEELLVSPILVMLFMSTYHMLDTVPDSVSRFYEEIFICLYKKHDKLDKPGFPREIKSKIVEYDAKDCFSAFCFLSFRKSDYGYSDESMLTYFRSALDLCGFDTKEAESIKVDVVDITNLIVNDGYDRYSYIHRSIQEYYTARYIKGLPDEKKKKFYDKVISSDGSRGSYGKVIEFLSDIDQHFYEKNFILEIFNVTGIVDINSGNYKKPSLSKFRSDLEMIQIDLLVLDDKISANSISYPDNHDFSLLDWFCFNTDEKYDKEFGINDIMNEVSKHDLNYAMKKLEPFLLSDSCDIKKEKNSGVLTSVYRVIDAYELTNALGSVKHLFNLYSSTCKVLYDDICLHTFKKVKSRDEKIRFLDF